MLTLSSYVWAFAALTVASVGQAAPGGAPALAELVFKKSGMGETKITWNGTSLVIPQHTEPLRDVIRAVTVLQDEITNITDKQAAVQISLESLNTTVRGLEEQWQAYTEEQISKLGVEAVNASVASIKTTADDAKDLAELNQRTIIQHKTSIDSNAAMITSNTLKIETNMEEIGSNDDDIAANLQNIKGRACLKGKYHSADNPEECIPCPRGQWQGSHGMTSCMGSPCTPGKWSAKDGRTTAAGATCEICPSGKFSSTDSSSGCKGTLCAAGKWHARQQTLAHTCKDCPKGTYNEHDGRWLVNHCEKCGLGKASNTLAATAENTCKPCGKGRYADAEQLTECKRCGPGKYADQDQRTAESACKQCGRGKYQPNYERTKSSDCTNCASGRWSNDLGRTTACAACTYTGSCGSAVKLGNVPCTATTNQVCVTKWAGYVGPKKCAIQGKVESCAQVKAKCEAATTCYAVQSRHWTVRQDHRTCQDVCQARFFGACVWYTSVCYDWVTQTSHSECRLCTANNNFVADSSNQYQVNDYGMY